jgi:hypothetical protein
MKIASGSIVEHRTKALATVALTRRPDVVVLEIDKHDFLDLYVQILPDDEEEAGFIGMGVVLSGTTQNLDTARAATAFARKKLEGKRPKALFYFPVLFLVFSMQNDKGYYSWLIMPSVDAEGPKLHALDKAECRVFDEQSLDEIVSMTTKWYAALRSAIVIEQS